MSAPWRRMTSTAASIAGASTPAFQISKSLSRAAGQPSGVVSCSSTARYGGGGGITYLFAGNYVFRMFGITVPAFQIMGGIIFLSRALRTLLEDKSRAADVGGSKRLEESDVEKAELDPSSVAIVPLGIPMLAGPGAITSTMVLVNLYPRIEQKFAVIGSIVGVGLVCYVVLLAAVPLSRVMGDRGRAVFAKIMALLLGAIGIQFMINGLRPVFIDILKAS